MLLTTHNMDEAEVLCDRVGIIENDRLLALDTVDNLRAAHSFNYKITYESDGRTTTPTTGRSFRRCRPRASTSTPIRGRRWKTCT